MPDRRFTFGPFVLDGHGTLSKDGAPVAISSRGVALLRALLAADGDIVAKAALMDAAWPNTNVEESNLTVQIAALRKSLGASSGGEDWIATVPRVGYRVARSSDLAEGPAIGTASPHSPQEKASIAVLPFTNMSSDAEQEFFADGLAEDLISDLSRVPGLVVIARNSTFTYKGESVDLRAVAKDLAVRYVLEGSVRRAADLVRVSAQLIDTADNRHLWVDRFDRKLADIFTLQDEIVGRIVNALADVLPSGEPIVSRRPANLEAYDLFVRGRVLSTQSPDANKAARPLLERAIELDPAFTEAHAWLALSHAFGWAHWGEAMEKHQPLALAASRRAVSLDPENAAGHTALGYVLMVDGKPDDASVQLEAALHINPNHADAWSFLGTLKVFEGAAVSGIADMRQAFRLNPHPPGWYYWLLGFAQYAAKDYDNAVVTLRHESAHRSVSQRILAASLAALGRRDEARREAEEFMMMVPSFSIGSWAVIQPFSNEVDRKHFVTGYLQAGLPP